MHLVDLKMEGRGGGGEDEGESEELQPLGPPRVRARTAITPHCRKMVLSMVPERGHLHWVFLEMEGKVGELWLCHLDYHDLQSRFAASPLMYFLT